jgi:hypothetical protein
MSVTPLIANLSGGCSAASLSMLRSGPMAPKTVTGANWLPVFRWVLVNAGQFGGFSAASPASARTARSSWLSSSASRVGLAARRRIASCCQSGRAAHQSNRSPSLAMDAPGKIVSWAMQNH